MSSQPPTDLKLTTQITTSSLASLSPVQSPAMATDTEDARRQSDETPVLSGSQRLPPEILALIFEFCLYPPEWEIEWGVKFRQLPQNNAPERREESHCYPESYSKSLKELCLVCWRWDQTVLSTPRLYNSLFIVINPDNDEKTASNKLSHTKDRLVRSGSLPLILFVTCYQSGSTNTQKYYNSIMEEINQCSPRWVELYFAGDCKTLSQICAGTDIQQPLAHFLDQMMVVPRCECAGLAESNPSNCFYAMASMMIAPPNFVFSLAQTSLMAVADSVKIIRNINWVRVKTLHVTLQTRSTADCLCVILEQASRLTCVQIMEFWSPSDHEILLDETFLVHEKLESLKLYSDTPEVYSDFSVFQKVAFPALKDLHVSISGPVDAGEPSRVEILKCFISRSGCSLKHLSLIGVDSLDHKLIEMLKELSSLEVLHISTGGHPNKMTEEVLSPLLSLIRLDTTNALLPNLRKLSYLVDIDPTKVNHDQHVEFILAEIRRPVLLTDNVERDNASESSKFPASFNLLANRDLIDKETVLRHDWGKVKKSGVKQYPTNWQNSYGFFMTSIKLHETIKFDETQINS